MTTETPIRPAPAEPTTPIRPAPAEPTTPIRPSEAIRLGCLIAPVQGKGEFFGRKGEACVLGAMALGFGYDGSRDPNYPEPWRFVEDRLPGKLEHVQLPPMKPSHLIYTMNDELDWSRERIADWLEGLGL